MIIELTIHGMSCAGCAATLQQALQTHPAIQSASVDFSASKAIIDSNLNKAELLALIDAKGFSAQ